MKLLDLFCGGGGAAVGYYRAGFDVYGVDLNPQPFYPFEFRQADALSLDYDFLLSFDAIHASPPCQQYSAGSVVARSRGRVYPDLFRPVHRMLEATGLPYVIENVVGSPAKGIGLCGTMFGLGVRRHRIFQSNVKLVLPDVPHTCSDHIGEFLTVAGSTFRKDEAALAMGIDWPIDKFQLKEAIPPVYCEFLGRQLLQHCEARMNSVSEVRAVSVSDQLGITVSEYPVNSVPVRLDFSVTRNADGLPLRNDERRLVPVTRRCKYTKCNEPLPQGTARRTYCNDLCRLRHFRSDK